MQHVFAAFLFIFNLFHKDPFHWLLEACAFCLNLSIVLCDPLLVCTIILSEKTLKVIEGAIGALSKLQTVTLFRPIRSIQCSW